MMPRSTATSLLLSSLRANETFEGFPFPVLIYNHNRKIVFVNPRAEQVYGFKESELLGMTTRVLVGKNITQKQVRDIAQTLYVDKATWAGILPQQDRQHRQFLHYAIGVPLRLEKKAEPVAYFCAFCAPGEQSALQIRLLEQFTKYLLLIAPPNRPSESAESLKPKISRHGEIIRMLSWDYSTKEIAQILQLAPATVRVVRWKHNQRQKLAASPVEKTPGGRGKGRILHAGARPLR